MVAYEIRSNIEAIEEDATLFEEPNFGPRSEAIDYLEFKVIDRIDGLLQTTNPSAELVALGAYARKLERQLEDIDDHLFRGLRGDIRAGTCRGTALRVLIDRYVGPDSSIGRGQDEIGYDNLDLFIAGFLLSQALPVETRARDPEMIYYQQTPARIIFELIEKAHLTEEDLFYDLGSGLGQVPILVNLLCGAPAKGIEFEPAYCDYARACAADLSLSRVDFINADARSVDYSEGTVFFMYTPFEGEVLENVLEKLRRDSEMRAIRLFTYGPCTPQVSRQSWLEQVDDAQNQIHRLGAFRNF